MEVGKLACKWTTLVLILCEVVEELGKYAEVHANLLQHLVLCEGLVVDRGRELDNVIVKDGHHNSFKGSE